MKRRRLKLAIGMLGLIMLSACVLLPDFVGQMKAGKYDPVSVQARPAAIATTPTPEEQTEPHTCGLHAMRSMYVAYGLDPDAFRLRFRLGTDQPAISADAGSTGTLHPDLFRVLAQDGFAVQILDLDRTEAAGELQTHLDDGQLALAVVYRGTYHWVLAGPSAIQGRLTVYDSLIDQPATTDVDAFLADALSITLVGPSPDGQASGVAKAHADGLAEMSRLYQRRQSSP